MDDTENLVIDEIATTEKIISNNTTDNSNLNTSSNDELNSFDHTEMLTNWVDNIIIPSITNFDNSLEIFKESATTFVNAPTTETLSNLKEAWLSSFLKWQHVEMFDIGLSEEIYYKNRINLYPTNVERIENNISNLNYDLDKPVNFSAQGLNSIDYLLFGIGENEVEIISKFSDENLKSAKYLTDLVDKMVSLTMKLNRVGVMNINHHLLAQRIIPLPQV